ncbi:hypothetical protein H5410_034775 [Solanum commersonii]|uniref:Uncharacterized protein n=1 Tax=Solanum commersonii TaxID=4109 RepID=A0A9J5YU98_SOLCO|nr:hypothetical protein H5410_034775 [Solanum commersonii]
MTIKFIKNLGSSVDRTLIKVFFTKKKPINQTNNIARRLKTAPHSTVNLSDLPVDIVLPAADPIHVPVEATAPIPVAAPQLRIQEIPSLHSLDLTSSILAQPSLLAPTHYQIIFR